MKKTILFFAMLLSFSCHAWGDEQNFQKVVTRFIKVVVSKDRKAIANTVSYPLHRKVPLSTIENPKDFLSAYDEILDERLLKALADSKVSTDWAEMGWRGIMFQAGSLWLNEDGKITAINYQTQMGKRKRAELIETDRRLLHDSLKDFVEPVLEWELPKHRVRIDRITDTKFRYAVWPTAKKNSDKPDLVLRNGGVTFDGSGGNHHYDFKSGKILYRCYVWELGDAETPPGEVEVYKGKRLLLKQPVIKVIKGP